MGLMETEMIDREYMNWDFIVLRWLFLLKNTHWIAFARTFLYLVD